MQKNKIYLGDCLELMRSFDDDIIDLTVTSPPYDNLRTYNSTLSDWNFSKFQSIAKELYRITKSGGVVVWVVGDSTVKGSETGSSFKQALYFMECGFLLHDTMIYQKNSLPKNHNRYEQDFEYMFVLSKGKPKTFNPIRVSCKFPEKPTARANSFFSETTERGRSARSNKKRQPVKDTKIKGNIWSFSVGKGHSTSDQYAFKHPAIFPEKLVKDHVLSWSSEGDTVFDPFAGSGTTCKVSMLNNRNYIAIERVPEYYEICIKRTEGLIAAE